jgi:exodeoxyribonuclease VII small subunit
MTYREAIARLEEIVQKIEAEEPDVDELGALVKEAHQLTEFCQKRLKSTEAEVEEALENLKK